MNATSAKRQMIINIPLNIAGVTVKVGLVFPWRPEPHRVPIFEKVREIVPQLYPFRHIWQYDTPHEVFNRAAARNEAVRDAFANYCDVVVICDADSIPEERALVDAIDGAKDGRLHIPFDTVRVIAGRAAKSKGDRYKRALPLYTYGPSCGGIFVIDPRAWFCAGGMDERITGWGYEDQIFLAVVRTFLGDPIYHPGVLWNFQHPRAEMADHKRSNGDLRDKYNAAMFDKAKITELQRGSNGFCT